MADTPWSLSGAYFESCNCDYLCLCQETKAQGVPDKGECIVAMVFQIENGRFGEVTLDGLGLVLVARTPGPMAHGDWTVGLVIDERANAEQRAALAQIGGGEVAARQDASRCSPATSPGLSTCPSVSRATA